MEKYYCDFCRLLYDKKELCEVCGMLANKRILIEVQKQEEKDKQ